MVIESERFSPRGSVGIPHRNYLKYTGNIDQNLDNRAKYICIWEFWTNYSPKTDLESMQNMALSIQICVAF